MSKHWQHTTPVGSDACVATPPKTQPAPNTLAVGTRASCTKCGKRIYVTRPDEGPESLKALLRF